MRQLVGLAAFLALLGGGYGLPAGRTAAAQGRAAVAAWAPREFPISFWCGPPGQYVTPDRFRQIAAAGFTLVMPPCEGPFTPEVNRRILDCARDAGLRAFIFDDRLPMSVSGVPDARARLDAVVAEYAHHPALGGYFLTDEPSVDKFPGLAEVVEYLRAKDPAHPAYINLFPNYASAEQLGTDSYEAYVEKFIRTVRPAILSYDHYHFLKSGDRPGFFANLHAVRSLADQYRIPFWQIVLAIPHLGYRQPDEAEKRWEAMQTLAGGGQGLMYFTYWTPPGQDFQVGSGIIGRDGTPSAQYEEVRRVNHDVRAIGKYLVGAETATVFQNGHIAPGGAAREEGTPVSFAGGGDVTVGLFRNDTHLYVLFANRDYKQPTTADALLNTGGRTPERLNLATGRWSSVRGTHNADGDLPLHLNLAPADAELYRW